MFTGCYAYLTFANFWHHHRKEQTVMAVLNSHGSRASIAFRKLIEANKVRWSKLSGRASELCEKEERTEVKCTYKETLEGTLAKKMLTVEPKQIVDLSKDWTSFIGSAVVPPSKLSNQLSATKKSSSSPASSLFILLEASPPSKDTDGKLVLRDVAQDKVVRLSDLAVPVAWKPGKPFGILVQSSPENYCKIGTAYIDGVLVLDDGLYVDQILTVDVKGQPYNIVDNLVAKEDKQIPLSPNPLRSPPFAKRPPANPDKPLRRKHSTEFSKRREGKKAAKESSKMSSVQETLVPEKTDPFEGQMKPPNVLIYTGAGKTSEVNFETYCQNLNEVIDNEKYVIYHLKQEHILTQPWSDNCVLVILVGGSETLDEKSSAKLNEYVGKGGRLICIGQPFSMDSVKYKADKKQEKEITVSYKLKSSSDPVTFATNTHGGAIDVKSAGSVTALAEVAGTPLVVEAAEDRGSAILTTLPLLHTAEDKLSDAAKSGLKDILIDILTRLRIKCHPDWQPPILTPAYLMGVEKKSVKIFQDIIKPSLKDGQLKSKAVSLWFTDKEKEAADKVTSDLLPVITAEATPSTCSFSFETYQQNYQGEVLGNVVLYCDVIPTTMTVFEGIQFKVPESVGVVAIAARQTKGKGRGGNKWLAPLGCAMFTIHARIPVGTPLANRLPFIQHIAALACVEAIRTKPGYENLELRVKWPNDIYYKNKQKIGGMLVQSSMMDGNFHALIGIGFNISNSEPTMCVNDAIKECNQQEGVTMAPLTTAEVIARTCTTMEKMINDIQKNGPDSFLETYYKRWLHGNTVVRLESEDGPEVSVIGLDKSGFLEVKTTDGKLISLQPDGNSFDMLKNLIKVKRS